MSYTITLLHKKEILKLSVLDLKPPPAIAGECQSCGKCCLFVGCPAFDQVSLVCKVYYNRPVACRQGPACAAAITEVDCPGYSLKGGD